MNALTRPQLHALYYYLRLNRAVDEQLIKLYRQGKVVGGVYSSRGQEAISVGTAYALDSQDFIGPMLRNVGAMMVRGYKPRDVFLQYMARKDGPTGGRDANTHFGDLKRGVIAPISVLGELVPLLAGVALAAKLRRESRRKGGHRGAPRKGNPRGRGLCRSQPLSAAPRRRAACLGVGATLVVVL